MPSSPTDPPGRRIPVLRLALAAAGIAFVCLAVDWTDQVGADGRLRRGFFGVLADANPRLLLASVLLIGLVYPTAALRWWLLLRARSLHVPLRRAFRLHMAASFFNYCVPIGSTGGDVIKAYYAARGSARRTDAVLSVFVDRAIGALGLVLLAGLVGLLARGHPVVDSILKVAWLGLLSGALGAAAYSSRRLRRLLPLDRLQSLPGGRLLARIDVALLAYRAHVPTVAATIGLALVGHLLLTVAVALIGVALIGPVPVRILISILPVLMLCATLPLTPQGIGTTEALGLVLIVDQGLSTANQLVGMLLLWRLFQIGFALTGALVFMRGDVQLHAATEDPREA